MDKELKEIIITTEDGEVLAAIPMNEGEIIQKKGITVHMNYGEIHKYIGNEETGKIYLASEED